MVISTGSNSSVASSSNIVKTSASKVSPSSGSNSASSECPNVEVPVLNSNQASSSPPQAPPIMSSRDMTSASLEETVISGQVIPCFNIGGEMRLCFPQILKQTLSAFHMEQICLACEELLIHVAPATNQQLSALKQAEILPVTAHQCGLITKSDAERLAAYLMTSKVSSSSSSTIEARLIVQESCESQSDHQDSNVVFVQHECFGKATGSLYPALYKSPGAKCISCTFCGEKINILD